MNSYLWQFGSIYEKILKDLCVEFSEEQFLFEKLFPVVDIF